MADDGNDNQPPRGRARGRARTKPEDVPQTSVRLRPSPAPSVRSGEEGSSVSDLTETMSVTTLGSVAGNAGSREDTISVCSNASSDHSKGLRVTIKPGFNKVGSGGEEFDVLTNYLHMNKTPNFQLLQYRVDFSPDEDSTLLKKLLVRTHEETLGAYIFDGHMLYTTKPIPMEKRKLVAVGTDNQVSFEITIRSVGYVLPSSPMYLQFYNMVMRKAMTLIDMEELGRHFFDRHAAISFPEDRLELWPGIVTAVRNHDVGILLCLEVTHKVLRMETCFDMLANLRRGRSQEEFESVARREMIGIIVITHYNRRTYKVDDIDFNVTPSSTFRMQDGTITTYADYFLKRYNVEIADLRQPMLVSYPKKRDLNKGITGNIYLIPELCNPTGLTDAMRKNFTLMKKLSEHLHMGPNPRKTKLNEFVAKLKNTQSVQEEFAKWDIDFSTEFVAADARKYSLEDVYLGPEGSPCVVGDRNADWTRALKGRQMLCCKNLKNWLLFVPTQDATSADHLIAQLATAGRLLNVNVVDPLKQVTYRSGNVLAKTIEDELRQLGDSVEFVFVVLPNNNLNVYADVKKTCILNYGIGCQCLLAKNMNRADPKAKQKLGSICTKVMIQINAKLGGIPWGVRVPVKKLMVLGFDVYHCSAREKESAGALVSTTDQGLGQYFSSVAFHKDKSELATNLTAGMRKALRAYEIKNNGALPDRVILFRDGVGDGQINYVLDYEIPRLKQGIKEYYVDAGMAEGNVKLAVVIVTKKINSRALLARSGTPVRYDNVPPGTVIDNTVTLPERYDFFLVSQSVNQGTVSPTNYNVVYDEIEWSPDKMQRLSFKLCHLYYNWCGTVAVPAPCQYAHKLAYLTGIAVNAEAPLNLANNLWYL